ncbi:benenodin family lasso peptide [Asticcacaulis endophyticus]|uniref:Benenodin family lasso peptide n=1 Tax=Asticcacaulis endophyticus TaxID=1395890 RepID=A0A918USR1_9CAUL|nr:benenodin family lasso peptide [Asticcacaulis endophyticus]GGZ32452.1 hypothetical protein GCM10011273_18260 [Asticcacaulis endophyticus]
MGKIIATNRDIEQSCEDIIELGTASIETQGGAPGGPEPSNQKAAIGISED